MKGGRILLGEDPHANSTLLNNQLFDIFIRRLACSKKMVPVLLFCLCLWQVNGKLQMCVFVLLYYVFADLVHALFVTWGNMMDLHISR